MDRAEVKLISRPWEPQDLLDDLQMYIDEEPDNYLNGRRTAMCMAMDYLKEFFAREQGCEYCNNTSTDILATTADGYAWLPKWANNFCPMCGRKLKEGVV